MLIFIEKKFNVVDIQVSVDKKMSIIISYSNSCFHNWPGGLLVDCHDFLPLTFCVF